jgi:hypothetical protein
MPEGERAEFERKEREERLAEREAALLKKELAAEAVRGLAEKGLSPTLAEFVTAAAEKPEDVGKQIEVLKAAFDAVVKEELLKRMAGKTPAAGDDVKQNSGGVSEAFARALRG